MFNIWSFWAFFRKKNSDYKLRFSSDAASSYDSLKSNSDPRFGRIKETLNCLKYGQLSHSGLRNRRWRRKVPPGIPVYQSCISRSKPDFHIIWHYSPHDESVIVIMLIDLMD